MVRFWQKFLPYPYRRGFPKRIKLKGAEGKIKGEVTILYGPFLTFPLGLHLDSNSTHSNQEPKGQNGIIQTALCP